MSATPPSDAASLLVPVHLDAWVFGSQSQQAMALYEADFSQLSLLLDPLPAPFYDSSAARPLVGVHLHWALPDALTHGGETQAGGQFAFPLVPNRWLIARLGIPVLGTTTAELSGSGVTSITLQAGASEPLAAGIALQIVSPDTQTWAVVVVAGAAGQGAGQISIQPYDFATPLPLGSSVRRVSANSALPAPASSPWQCKLWVVQSDFLAPFAKLVGTTASMLTGSGDTSITLDSGWQGTSIPAGTQLELAAPGGAYAAGVVVSQPVNSGDAIVSIQAFTSAASFPAGSALQFPGSAFLGQPTSMTVADGQATVTIGEATIGASYGVEAWEARGDPAGGQLFLQAVGPGNISFAAYAPFVKNVFSFTDSELPPEGTGVYLFSYLVVGWYSDPSAGDPLRGVGAYPQGAAAYVPPLWASEAAWQAQSEAERFQTILSAMQWSVQGDPGASPPSASLYHALVSGVQWPYTTLGSPVDSASVRVAVGNTSIDALAALIQYEACQQANASPDPQVQAAWYSAGDTLATLIQAAMYDLVDDYGVPGGSVLIEQQIEQAWYGSNPGGTVWEFVAAVPQVAGQSAAPPQLTPEQSAALAGQLATLNQRQRAFDQSAQTLQWLQANLYMLWLKYGMAGMNLGWPKAPETNPDWPELSAQIKSSLFPDLFGQVWAQYCAVGAQQAQLPDPADPAAANAWANATWRFPAAGGGSATLAGLGLALKAGALPPFWHPNDPVILIAGLDRAQSHGEDGRFNADGTLTCRLPGQAIGGIAIPGQPALTAQALASAGLNLNPSAGYTSIPSIPALLQEAFFADPGNAAVIAAATGADAATVAQAIAGLLAPGGAGAPAPPSAASWVGQAPPPFALAAWQQAWAPLFLEWDVDYFPTGAGGQFAPSDWSFDGAHYTWNGSGFNASMPFGYTGRALLTPQAALLFKSTIASYLQANATLDSQQIEQLIGTVAGWDLLSQSLSGLTDQLITRVPQPTFPPPPAASASVECPHEAGSTPPDVATLIGDQYHSMPMLTSPYVSAFFPVRSGFVQFQKLQVVDAFGQIFGGQVSNPASGWPLTEQGFQPQLGQGLAPPSLSGVQLPTGAFQLPPSLIQAARLDLRFLTNDGSGQDIAISSNTNAICGWLLPNHLDGSLAIYDAGGALLGELLALPQPNNWRPRPGPPGDDPPPQQPGAIANAALRAVVASIAAQAPEVFGDLLSVIDETLWMVDPLGGRKDQFLSVLIGRPLAVVQAELQLSLLGQPNYNQLWDAMLTGQPGSYQPHQDTGGIEQVAFPVRLGSLDLRDDGLIGYYLPAGDGYTTFYAVHTPEQLSAGDSYIKPIVQPAGGGAAQYQGEIALSCAGEAATVTLIMDPRGSVHAYSGILPVTSAALPADVVESFIRQLKVTFRTGPLIADPGTLRTPKPADDQGAWLWLQAVAGGWEQDQIVDADDLARLPDGQLQLREGWLQLSDLDDA